MAEHWHLLALVDATELHRRVGLVIERDHICVGPRGTRRGGLCRLEYRERQLEARAIDLMGEIDRP